MSVKAEFILKKGVPIKWIEYVRGKCESDMRDHYFFWEAYQLLDLLEKAGAFSRLAMEGINPHTYSQLLSMPIQDSSTPARIGVGVKGLKILDAGSGFGVVDCLLSMMGGDLTLLDYDMEYLNKSRDAFSKIDCFVPFASLRAKGSHAPRNDTSPYLSLRAKGEAISKLEIPEPKFIKGNILSMPFNPPHPPLEKGGWEGFDLVWNGGVIEHFEKPSEAIRNMSSVVKPGGYIFVSVPALFTPHTFIIRPYRRRIRNFYFDIWGREKSYTERGLAEEMKKAGLKDVLTSTCNIRRTFVDDYLIWPRLKKYMPNHISQILNTFDWLEINIPFLHYLGFTVGAIGRKA